MAQSVRATTSTSTHLHRKRPATSPIHAASSSLGYRTGEASDRLTQPKLRSATQRRGSNTKPFLSSGSFKTCSSMPSSLRGLGWSFACVASIDEGRFYRRACDMLNFLRQRSHLGRSCSSAWVTCTASRWSSMSAAMCTLLPLLRL